MVKLKAKRGSSVVSSLDSPANPNILRRYSSPLIAERRQRILSETKRLIGEVGADNFTLRDLGQAAGVSVTTIYNVFGDKEGVIAHALREFHAGIKLNLPRSSREIAGFLRAIAHTSAIVLENRAYALALADLYFSRSLVPAIFEVIRSMPLQVFGQWRWLAEHEGQLRDGIDPEFIDTAFANLEWATIKDWGCGRVTDEELISARQRTFLLLVITSSRDPGRSIAEHLLGL